MELVKCGVGDNFGVGDDRGVGDEWGVGDNLAGSYLEHPEPTAPFIHRQKQCREPLFFLFLFHLPRRFIPHQMLRQQLITILIVAIDSIMHPPIPITLMFRLPWKTVSTEPFFCHQINSLHRHFDGII